jgi:excisionase family DNA binding protein
VSVSIDSSVVPSNRAARRHPEVAAARRWASIADTASYLGVTTRTVKVMLADGRIVGYRGLGNRLLRIDLAEVDDALGASC